MRTGAHRARVLRQQGALAVLRQVHAHPGTTRAELARALDLRSSSATEITARLKAMRLIDEVDAPPTGERGRPSPILTAHPDGPLVCAVDISHERWRVSAVELGGHVVDTAGGQHRDRAADAVLPVLRAKIDKACLRYGDRLCAVSVAVPGTIQRTRLMQASHLRWRDLSLEPLRPDPDLPLLIGNDASLAGLAEARRGAGIGTRVLLHLTVEVGIGGVLIVDGQVQSGATGAGGEFGHMPFGDPQRQCPCGARGCWDLDVDGRAMARALGQPPPKEPRTAAEEILAAAGAGTTAAGAAVATVAAALGRGIAALVNALDPELVTLSGLGSRIADVAPAALDAAYREGLMWFRRATPPPLAASTLGTNGASIGAAEAAFDGVLTDDGLAAWSRLRGPG